MKQNRWTVFVGVSLVMASASAGHAETRIEAIARHLRGQGYSDIEISRTWLGRTRIEAQRGTVEREIIVNPRTGEILRDYWDDDDDETVLGRQDRDRDERRDDGSDATDDDLTGIFEDAGPDHGQGDWNDGGGIDDTGLDEGTGHDGLGDDGLGDVDGWGGSDGDIGGGWNDGPDDHGGGHGGGTGGDHGGDHSGGHGDHSRDY